MPLIGTGIRYCSSSWAIGWPSRSRTVVTAGMSVDGNGPPAGAGVPFETSAIPAATGVRRPASTRPPASVTASRRVARVVMPPIVPRGSVPKLRTTPPARGTGSGS